MSLTCTAYHFSALKNFFFLSIIFWLAFVSCTFEKTNTKEAEKFSVSIMGSQNQDIVGVWIMCSTVSNGQMIQKNTCPIVTFKNDGIGYVSNNAAIFETFHWKLEKPSLKIIYEKADVNNTFPDTNYYAHFYTEKSTQTLSLRHNGQTFYLDKSIE